MSGRALLAAAAAALCAAVAAPLPGVLGIPGTRAHAAQAPRRVTQPASQAALARHVVVVGISGLTWSTVTPAGTPELWRLAAAGSAGSLVDYAQQPLACPADGWLTLNSAARARGPRPCTALPAVVADGRSARIPALPGIIRANLSYHESPSWGLLGRLAGCATAVGPGAALALASPAGGVASYLPSPADLSAPVLARCPLTVIDLGQLGSSERGRVAAVDRQLAVIAAELPSGTLLLVTAPGAATEQTKGAAPSGPPHLMTAIVAGPGYADGLLTSAATRRQGIVTLTDLTPTVAGWLGRQLPAGTVGAKIGRADRGDLAATVTSLRARDTAEQVWIATHGWFFLGYPAAALLAFGIPVVLFPGGAPERRRRRARCWMLAGVLAAGVPLGSYLANLAPWWQQPHPGWWLYGMTAAWTLVVAAAVLAGPWRRGPIGPFGAVCMATLLLLAVDVTAGSRLQLDAPFGLSLLVSGRYYGIGNDALGVYCVSALVAAAWSAVLACGRRPRARGAVPERPGRPGALRGPVVDGPVVDGPVVDGPVVEGPVVDGRVVDGRVVDGRVVDGPVLAAGVVGLLAVVASGWPGFGAKVGGTIALVPCLLLLLAWLAGIRVSGRWALPVALSGLVVFLLLASVSYLLPAAGVSDMGAFAGDLLHGRAGDLLERKVSSNVGSLTLSVLGWLVPLAAVAAGLALWRPAALRLRTLADAFAVFPLLRPLTWLCWLVLAIGWFADDQGVIVPAAALSFAVPLMIGMASSFSRAPAGAGYLGTAFAGPSVAGGPPPVDQPPK
jgi:hypothetical protein